MIGFNGGLIGKNNPTIGGASIPGVWTPREQEVAVRRNQWAGIADPNYSNVSLLLHFDDSNGSVTFTDNSSNAFVPSVSGNAQISTAQNKFGGSSGLFDGTGDFLSYTNSAFNISSSQDFTWEGWLYATTLAGTAYKCILHNDHTFTNAPRLYLKNGTLLWFANTADVFAHQTTVVINTWYHFAVVRASNVVRSYLNGVQSSSSHSYSAATTNNFRVASDSGTNGQDFAGHLDDVRITKGVGRYTATFTPPAAPFQNF